MDEKLAAEMLKDLHDAVGYVVVPPHAVTIKDIMKESGLADKTARLATNKLVESGAWGKYRKGNIVYYWKVLGG